MCGVAIRTGKSNCFISYNSLVAFAKLATSSSVSKDESLTPQPPVVASMAAVRGLILSTAGGEAPDRPWPLPIDLLARHIRMPDTSRQNVLGVVAVRDLHERRGRTCAEERIALAPFDARPERDAQDRLHARGP